MRLTQERILTIVDTATEYQDRLINFRDRIVPELLYINSIIRQGKLEQAMEAISNLSAFVIGLTEIDIKALRILADEKAHFNPMRVKHNEYMRSAYYRRKAKKAYNANPLDLPEEENQYYEPEPKPAPVPHQNNEYQSLPSSNAEPKQHPCKQCGRHSGLCPNKKDCLVSECITGLIAEAPFLVEREAEAKQWEAANPRALARIEAEAAKWEETTHLPDSEEDLKAKFGDDFKPLPPRIGLRRRAE